MSGRARKYERRSDLAGAAFEVDVGSPEKSEGAVAQTK